MISNKKHIFFLFFFIISTLLTSTGLFAQSSQITFGKNRVQYKDFDWQFYETDNFRIYFYQGGQDMGKYVILSSEICMEEISQLLNYQLSDPLDIIVYNDISDMHQTNIGIKEDVEGINGTIQLKNNKLFVYFNGEHSDLDRQIKEGITRLYLQKVVGGNGFQQLLQKSFLVDLPNWFTEGLIKYSGNHWDTELENQLRVGIVSGKFSDLSKLNLEEQILVGHSLWSYVEQVYGLDAVSNLLYLARINRSVESAFMFVTGKPLNNFLEEWYFFHLNKFKSEVAKFEEPNIEDALPLKKQKNYVKDQAKLSPDGKYLAYTINDIGKWKVQVFNIEDETTETILKGGFRTISLETDMSNPQLAWEPRGKKLSVIYEKKDLFYISHYDSEEFKREKKPEAMRKFQKVFDFSYAEDSKNILMSAMQNGQIDIFKYYLPSNRTTRITDDFYDDLQASYIEIAGRSGVLFISNRPNDELIKGRLDTILPNATFDVFFYDFNNPFQKLSQISFTPLANESLPQAFTDSTYTFLSDNSGIISQYEGDLQVVKVGDRMKYVYTINEDFGEEDSIVLDQGIPLDSALAFGETVNKIISQELVPIYKLQGKSLLFKKYAENISDLSIGFYTEEQVEVILANGKKEFLLNTIDYAYSKSSDTSAFMINLIELDKIEKRKELEKKDSVKIEAEQELQEDKTPKIFQSKFDDWENISEAHREALSEDVSNSEENSGTAFKFTRTRQYFLKFMTEDVSFSLDNSLLVTNYQPFNPGSPVFNQPALNGMMRFGITDLFEDHKIHGGFRIPINFRGSEVYVTYENFKKRWDKSLTYYRKSNSEDVADLFQNPNAPVSGTLNTRTNIVESQLKYPFNQLNSMRFKFGFRNDRFIVKSTDERTLFAPNTSQNWLYSRVEFVHDHTLPVAKNIKNGFRVNVYYEFQKEIPTKEDTVLNQNVQLPIFNNSYMMLWGVDARHYQKVYKTIIWANRFAYSSSIGTKKMVYYLGGMDGMLSPGFNQTTPVNLENNYAYQSLGVNVRGFQQNIRNGNSYAVLNSELRIPIFSAFRKTPIKSKFLENIQLIGFFDIGTAWEGITPFSNGNIAQEVRQNATQNPSAIARVDIYKQPIVMGFGAGLRTEIMGYFIRTDIGWGYDTGKVNKPRFQVALGYDF